MSLSRGMVALLALSLLAASAWPASLAGPGNVTSARVAFAPTLDGRLDDWPPLPQVIIGEDAVWHSIAQGGRDATDTADVRLAWDQQALYLAIARRDDVPVRVRSAAEIDSGDSIVVTLQGDGAREINQFVIALLSGRSLVWRVLPEELAGEAHAIGRAIAATTHEAESETVYELSFPWSELRGLRAVPGGRFTLTVAVCDDDGNGLKGCLEETESITLTTTGMGPVQTGAGDQRAEPFFPTPKAVRFDDRSFLLDGTRTLLFGGEIEYTSLPETAWPDRLSLAKSAGFNTIVVTAPWAHYQPVNQGAVDLSDLSRFLEACAEAGLWAQVSLGPGSEGRLSGSGVPGWVTALPSRQEQERALRQWLSLLLPVIAARQMSQDGAVIAVVIHPLPDRSGRISAGALEQLLTAVRQAGLTTPVLTADLPAARGNSQAMANLLDTYTMYDPREVALLEEDVSLLEAGETGPALVNGPCGGRRLVGRVKASLAQGASGVLLSGFATGTAVATPVAPQMDGAGVVDATGVPTSTYSELRLLGEFLHRFRADLAVAPAPGVPAETGDTSVRAVARYGPDAGFLFVWSRDQAQTHQVRVRYTDPQTGAVVTIPEAGTIPLPPGDGKALLLDTPFGRGRLRYCTSEPLSLHTVGDRTVVTVYGDPDTPGEIAIQLPSPPLVTGDAARQQWDADTGTLVLDYFHGAQDKHLLVDELEIIVLSRERAANGFIATEAAAALTLAADALVTTASLTGDRLIISMDCPAGETELGALLSRPPSAVFINGKPADFTFTSPARRLALTVTTPPFSESQRPSSTWEKLSHTVLGGPPDLHTVFERARFQTDPGEISADPMHALGGEAAGYAKPDFNDRRWYRLALGPWRSQSKDIAGFAGVGWYRLDLKLPRAHGWRIPYYANLSVRGSGLVYFNGVAIGSLPASGDYRLPIPPSLVRENDKNMLVVAVLGKTEEAGLYAASIAADESRLTRARMIEIRF